MFKKRKPRETTKTNDWDWGAMREPADYLLEAGEERPQPANAPLIALEEKRAALVQRQDKWRGKEISALGSATLCLGIGSVATFFIGLPAFGAGVFWATCYGVNSLRCKFMARGVEKELKQVNDAISRTMDEERAQVRVATQPQGAGVANDNHLKDTFSPAAKGRTVTVQTKFAGREPLHAKRPACAGQKS
mgnify:FL=1